MNRFEKIAWYNLAVCMVTAMVFMVLFVAFEDTIGAARALGVASSSLALFALMAFGRTLFKQGSTSEFITIDAQGMVTRYAYKKFLIASFILAFVLLCMISFLIIKKVPYTPVLTVSIGVFTVAAIVGLLFLYYATRKRSSLESEPETSDLYQHGPDMDERDLAIYNGARTIGLATVFCCVILGLVGLPYVMQNQSGSTALSDYVSKIHLVWPSLVLPVAIVFVVSQSFTTLVLYLRGVTASER